MFWRIASDYLGKGGTDERQHYFVAVIGTNSPCSSPSEYSVLIPD